jgi:hypothetical protein
MSKSTMIYFETPDGGSNSFMIYGDFPALDIDHLADTIFVKHLADKSADIQAIANSVVNNWKELIGEV